MLSILAKCLYLSFPTFIIHVSYSISTLLLVSFIHFHARFSSGKGRAGSIPRRTINTSRWTAIPDSSASSTPRRDQERTEMLSRHVVVPLGTVPWVWPAGRASPIFPRTFWTYGRTNAAGISRLGELTRHSLYKFHSCALCREVTYHELFAKVTTLSLALLWQYSLSHHPRS